MAKIIKFPIQQPEKKGHRKVAKRKKKDLEDQGQLNLFNQIQTEGRVKSLQGESFFEEALAKDEVGDESAINLYLKAIDAGQSISDALCNLGIIMSGKREYSKAVDYLTRSLKENPRHFEAHYNLANVYSDLGNYPLAQMHYEVSIEMEPSFPNSYYNLGLVFISQKKYKEAIQVIDKYIELSPMNDNQQANDLIKTLNTFAK